MKRICFPCFGKVDHRNFMNLPASVICSLFTFLYSFCSNPIGIVNNPVSLIFMWTCEMFFPTKPGEFRFLFQLMSNIYLTSPNVFLSFCIHELIHLVHESTHLHPPHSLLLLFQFLEKLLPAVFEDFYSITGTNLIHFQYIDATFNFPALTIAKYFSTYINSDASSSVVIHPPYASTAD